MIKAPFTCIISGGTGTGKTQWVLMLIKHANEVIEPPPSHILYCYSEINNDIITLKRDGIEVYHGVPTKEELMSKPKNLLLIFDDLISEIDTRFLEVLYTKGSHHWNMSVVSITQNLFDKKIRVARINSHLIILMKNPQGFNQISTLGTQ